MDATALDGWCRANLGSAIATVRWRRDGTGVVWHVELDDGRAVSVKAHRTSSVGVDHLRAAVRVQARMAAACSWVPAPVAGPAPLGDRDATAELLLDTGVAVASPSMMASALGTVLAGAGAPPPGLGELWCLRPLDQGLWPPPHDDRFDLSAPGGEWIDELARHARGRLVEHAAHAPRVVGHADWRAEHVRFVPVTGSLAAVYDWDSLASGTVEAFVGQAALAFPVDFTRPSRWPSMRESADFARAYAEVHSTTLDVDAVDAAHLYGLAYTARCAYSARVHDEVLELLAERGPRYERWSIGT